MSLAVLDYTITPTPSGFIDGHYPNGNDGTGGIPLVWATIPDFRKKQVGTSFSVQLFTTYLTQAGGAVATLGFGTLPTGWTLSSAGLLSYSGTGIGIATIQVVATISGDTPASSNLFTIESINTIASSDTLPPTIPTGIAVLSTTPSGGMGLGRIQVQTDCPSDLATALIPSSGMSEVVFLLNNVLNGAVPTAIGLQLEMQLANITAGGGQRKWTPGFYQDISYPLISAAGGIPNAGGSGGTTVAVTSASWAAGGGNTFNLTAGNANGAYSIVYYSGTATGPHPNIGDTIVVSGANPSGYNTTGASVVGASFNSFGNVWGIEYANAFSGAYVSGGTISFGGAGSAAATINFAAQSSAPTVGSTISVSGVTPSGYNTTSAVVTASTTTSISFALATNPGSYVSGGMITLVASGSSTPSNDGPVCKGTNGVICRLPWSALESLPSVYTFSLVTKILSQAAAFSGNPVVVFLMIVGRTFDGTNPAPPYLQPKTYQITSETHTGYNIEWWDPYVLTRFQALVNALGTAFDGNASFAGLATQETAISAPVGGSYPGSYNSTAYMNAIISMDQYISSACPTSRHLMYENFLQDATIAAADEKIDYACSQAQANGTIIAGPDLGPNTGSVVTRCYPRLGGYHFGLTVTQTGQTPTKFLSTGPTGCAIENSEQEGNGDPVSGPPLAQATIYSYATTGTLAGGGKGPLNLDIIPFEWGLATNSNGENFKTWATNIIQAHTVPFGTWSPSGAMPTGTVVQTGVNYAVTGYGNGVGVSSDEWSAARAQVNGDFTIIAQLAGVTGTTLSTALAGISIRETTAPGSRAAHIIVGRTTLYSAYRGSANGALIPIQTALQNFTSTLYLKIQKLSGTLYFWYATSPNTWISLGSVVLSLVPSNYAECFATCGGQTTPVTATFNQVNVQDLASPVYTYLNLSAGSYTVNAYAQDLAGNQSVPGTAVTVAIS